MQSCFPEIIQRWLHSSFLAIRHFLTNPGRILQVLTLNGSQPLNVNAGRILPAFGIKCRITEKIECLHF